MKNTPNKSSSPSAKIETTADTTRSSPPVSQALLSDGSLPEEYALKPKEYALEATPRRSPRMPKHAGIGPVRKRRGENDPEVQADPAMQSSQGQQASSLGSLEAEIMGLLWEIGRPATGMEVMEVSLYKRRREGQEPISFASIATTLRRLEGKGLLRMEKGRLRAPIYTPTMEREQMAVRILNNVSVTLLGKSLRGLLAMLMGTNEHGTQKVSPAEREQIGRLAQALDEVAEAKEHVVEEEHVVENNRAESGSGHAS